MTTAAQDPFLDDDTHVDFTPHAEDKEIEALALEPAAAAIPTYDPKDFEVDEVPGESLLEYLKRAAPDAEVTVPEAKVVSEVAPEAVAPVPDPTPTPGSEVHQFPDGSSLSVEKTKKGWRATLDAGDEAIKPEVFYGTTKDEMWQNVAAGKINATKKIREQNRRIKLEVETTPEPAAQPAAQPAVRELSADDIFDIRTKLESNPDLAFETWFQKKTGLSTADLVKMVQKGATAADELDAESVAREFVSLHPDYYNLDANRDEITGFLTKKFLRTTLTEKNADELFNRLVAGGHWTTKNLSEAYDDLSESGLLVPRPVATAEPEPEPEPAPAPRQVAPAKETVDTPDNERIVRTVRRPRAGLGLSSKETVSTVHSNEPEKPPSADELDTLTDAQLAELYNGVRRLRATTRR